MWTGNSRWMRETSPVASRTARDGTSECSGVLDCNCGIGALETTQQDVSDSAASCVRFSPMFIRSHWDCVFGVAHSASFEERSAHAESGAGPTPKRLKAKAKMSDRLTNSESTMRATCEASTKSICPLLTRDCDMGHGKW